MLEGITSYDGHLDHVVKNIIYCHPNYSYFLRKPAITGDVFQMLDDLFKILLILILIIKTGK